MYFIDLDEESLQIAEKILKSYNVVYVVKPKLEKISRRAAIRKYDVEVNNISIEFYDYLQNEINGKIVEQKFEQARKQTQLSELEKCLQAPFAGKNIATENQRPEDVVGYKAYQEQIKNNKIKQMEEQKLQEQARKDATKNSGWTILSDLLSPNILSGIWESAGINPDDVISNSAGFKITFTDSSDMDEPDIQIMSWNPFDEEE